ncbi:bacteriohemerythrin [Azospirillum agricola]|uniref:bacteriohemerythrin n=1 Tax=Azospirillum agricola TaxID=1720247 RepID=UPI000A0F2207|nr:bacteriohemerythrin [Azospirillum agricola]SMH58063.1 hemerythrin-like metal-binding domain protein [Azospirillum lipoferum]
MSVILWRRQLSVGQPTIDDDHKHLIAYLNELDAALNAERFQPVRVAKILVKLLEYTKEHFAREERMMQAVRYPHFREHAEQHREAVRAVSELSHSFSVEPTHENAAKLYKFTADWLVRHIILQDTQLTPYVKGVWT